MTESGLALFGSLLGININFDLLMIGETKPTMNRWITHSQSRSQASLNKLWSYNYDFHDAFEMMFAIAEAELGNKMKVEWIRRFESKLNYVNMDFSPNLGQVTFVAEDSHTFLVQNVFNYRPALILLSEFSGGTFRLDSDMFRRDPSVFSGVRRIVCVLLLQGSSGFYVLVLRVQTCQIHTVSIFLRSLVTLACSQVSVRVFMSAPVWWLKRGVEAGVGLAAEVSVFSAALVETKVVS